MDENQELGWLIRDTSNRIRGPFKQAEVAALIKKGQLKGKTEISRANSYWFAIEEKVELGRFFPEFNGGRPPPEQPTQMTATLTEADIQDHGVEITTFTAVPPAAKEAEKPAEDPQSGQIEWLSDEFAEEFGEDFGSTISVQTDASGLNPLPATPPQAPDPEQPTPKDTLSEERAKHEAKQEMLRRATVKADTLPSEHKHFHGERPKPIDTLMRSPGKPGASAIREQNHATVSVPVEEGPSAKLILEDEDPKSRERRGKRNLLIGVAVGALIAIGAAAFFLLPKGGHNPVKPPVKPSRGGVEAGKAAKLAVVLSDLEGAKSALADLEVEPGARGEASTYLAQAVVKKEFLYDVEGAMLALQMARQQAHGGHVEAEVDNLLAVYGFERDPAASTELLKRNLDANSGDPVLKYNLALAYLRTNRPVDAIALLDGLLSTLPPDGFLVEDAALGLGWALEAHCGSGARDAICKRSADAEDAYLRALAANAASAKARLGLALFRLRRGGIKASEGDFRSFIDLAPDLDPPTRAQNFRKLADNDFYAFAHSQIVELNTPSQNMSKPSSLIMAADAILSCMQGRTSDAGKILEGALNLAPGDPNVLKATGYSRWKDGQLNELIDSLKDLRDRNSFAVNLMLGKSYAKLHKRDQAEKHFRALIEIFPNRSEGHALLGDLLSEQAERADEARTELQGALKKEPLDLVALRALARLGIPVPIGKELQRNLPF